VAVTFITESGQAFGAAGGGVDVVGVPVTEADTEPDRAMGPAGTTGVPETGTPGAPGRAAAEALAEAALLDPLVSRSLPVGGGLLDGTAEASGTPSARTFAAPFTEGTSLPPSKAPMAQTNNTAPTAEPAMATMRRRRYTDVGSGPLGSFTCGN
jgi:hypothetical protein